jgi:uncharacterized repeat protein (TIGR01451 family)
MRKAAYLSGGGLLLLVLVTVVRAKEEPGSRQTFGQRVNSMFGLIDRGESAPPPPPPPDMPSYGQRRTPHTTVQQGQPNSGANYEPRPGAAAAAQAVTAKPLPPTPHRDNSFATADDAPVEEAPTSLGGPKVQRPQLLERSRTSATGGAFSSRNTTSGQAGGAAAAGSTTLPNSSYSSRPTTTAPRTAGASANASVAAPLAVEQAAPRSTGGAPALPSAVVSSRRRSNAVDVPALSPTTTTPAASADATPELQPIPIQSGAATSSSTTSSTTAPRADAFVPETPFTADTRSARPYGDTPAPTAKPFVEMARSAQPSLTQIPVAEAKPEPMVTPIPTPLPTLNAPPSVAPQFSPAPVTASPTIAAPTASAEARAIAIPSADSSRQAGVLSAFNSPEITVETLGPQRISIGREATYRVVVRNRGQSEARQVVVSVGLPQSAEIAELHGTSGHTTSADEHATGKPLEWRIDTLPARAEEELTLVVIPRRSETFDLQIGWTCSPGIAVAAIEVEEPRLHMAISGPTEVTYGEQRLYKLTVSNPGTGTAENVELQLMPLSPGDGDAVAHRIGSLKAGDSLSVEVELTARQAGKLQIRTEAVAAGGLKSSAVADVTVRRAALEVAVAAPKMLFAGVPGNYEVRVRNTGDDFAKNVRLNVALPQNAKLINAGPAPKTEAGGELSWLVDRLPAGAEQVYTIRCALGQGGRQELTATASADGDIRKTAQAATSVQAVADLVLDVVDAPGPIAVGQPIVYEIKVRNRGMKSAEGVDVVAFFSEGIEPEKAEGHPHEKQPGMVVFETLATVGAAQEKVLKVTARATMPGNHRLRVELHSANPQTDMSQEDSTFFYADDSLTTTSSGNSAAPIATTPSSDSRYATPTSNGPNQAAPANSATPGMFTPVNVQPIQASASANVSTTATASPIPAVQPYSDSRYGTPANLPAVQPAAAQGATNAPATVYPATMPVRQFSNGLR